MGAEKPTERQITIAAKLYEVRDTARTLLGDKYRARMEDLGQSLNRLAAEKRKDVISVLAGICEEHELQGIDLMMVMAAAVEIVEPS